MEILNDSAWCVAGLDGLVTSDSVARNSKVADKQQQITQYFNLNNLFYPTKKNLSKDQKEELRVFVNSLLEERDFVNSLDSNHIMAIFVAFRDLGEQQNMIKLYNMVSNQTFKESIMAKEQMLVAFNKTNNPDETIRLGLDMIEKGQLSGDVFGGVGKAYLMKSKTAKSEYEKIEWLKLSAYYYEKGFNNFVEFYPGINAVYRYIDLDNLERAEQIAKVVYLATLKEGAAETKDYWCASTRLEAGCIANLSEEELDASLNYLLKIPAESWCYETTIQTLSNVNEKFKSKKIEKVIGLLQDKANGKISEDQIELDKGNDERVTAINANSYHYRGLASNFEGASALGGNMRFGGQLPDHMVARKDIEFFDGILALPINEIFPKGEAEKIYGNDIDTSKSFNDIDDTEVFIRSVDKFIRYHYGTENFAKSGLKLEENAEINNSIYDQTVNAMLDLSGARGKTDSRTNISAMFAMGMGDCRHHAQVKQIMFDRWQGKQMSEILHDMYVYGATDEKEKQFFDLLNTEMRTVDVEVRVPIEIESIYKPVKTSDGKYVARTDLPKDALEEHTMNILVQKDNQGRLVAAKMVDAFYQENYDWANHDIDINEIKVGKNKNGKIVYMFPLGEISASKVDIGQAIPIKLTPAVYAGPKDIKCVDEHGNNIRFIGLPMDMTTLDAFVEKLQSRSETIGVLNQARAWNNAQKLNNSRGDSDE